VGFQPRKLQKKRRRGGHGIQEITQGKRSVLAQLRFFLKDTSSGDGRKITKKREPNTVLGRLFPDQNTLTLTRRGVTRKEDLVSHSIQSEEREDNLKKKRVQGIDQLIGINSVVYCEIHTG